MRKKVAYFAQLYHVIVLNAYRMTTNSFVRFRVAPHQRGNVLILKLKELWEVDWLHGVKAQPFLIQKIFCRPKSLLKLIER